MLSAIVTFVEGLGVPFCVCSQGEAVSGFVFPNEVVYLQSHRLIIHPIPLLEHDFLPDLLPQISTQAEKSGLRVVHLCEDVWCSKTAVVQSRLKALLGISERIPARLTQVRRIDKSMLDKFLIDSHLQVTTVAKYKYGLFLPKRYFRILKQIPSPQTDELLVAVASFSGGKNILRNGQVCRSFELIRFANLLDCTVVGGLDKLLKKFGIEHQPDDIMTYADRDWSNGKSYEKIGFERVDITPPQRFWVHLTTFERYYENNEIEGVGLVKVYNTGNYKYLKTTQPRLKP